MCLEWRTKKDVVGPNILSIADELDLKVVPKKYKTSSKDLSQDPMFFF